MRERTDSERLPFLAGTDEGDVPRICDFLVRTPNPAVEDAVLRVLPGLRGAAAERLLEVLFRRGRSRGLVGLIHAYHLLAQDSQKRLASRAGELASALRTAVSEGRTQVSLNAISQIERSGDARMAYLLARTMNEGSDAVRARSAEALCELVSGYVREHPEDSAGSSDDRLGCLVDAAKRSLAHFERHLQTRAVESAMILSPYVGDEFGAIFSVRNRRVLRAAGAVIQSTSDPRLVGFAYRGLAWPVLREAIARSLGERIRPAFMAEMIREIGRLDERGVRRGMKQIKRVAWLRHGAAPLLTLPEALYGNAVAFVTALGLPSSTGLFLMRELIMTGPPGLQRPALEALIAEKLDSDGRVLRTVASWGDPVLSPIAENALPRPDKEAQLNAGSGTARGPRRGSSSADVMTNLCHSSNRAERLEAIRAIRANRSGARLSSEIMRLARDTDSTVRSAALNALQEGARPLNRRILTDALQHPDPRMQANAIEGLDRLGFDLELSGLSGRLGDADNRVRANIVRAFLRIDPKKGTEALAAMLSSPDRSSRISGMWVIRDRARSNASPVAPEIVKLVGEICAGDVDPRIRSRAREVLALVETATPAKSSDPLEGILGELPC